MTDTTREAAANLLAQLRKPHYEDVISEAMQRLDAALAQPAEPRLATSDPEAHRQAIADAEADKQPAEPARAAEVPSVAQLNSACMSYRHDFGLMDKEEQERMRWAAKEWLHAWRKEFSALATPTAAPQPASAVQVEPSSWWALVMGAAAALEDAANCLHDPDAERARRQVRRRTTAKRRRRSTPHRPRLKWQQ